MNMSFNEWTNIYIIDIYIYIYIYVRKAIDNVPGLNNESTVNE